MARPNKQGVDYFPLDVHLDDKVTIIEAEHGLIGFAILIKLLQKIYSEGYFYECGEVQQILFCKSISTDRNTVTTIINDCVKWGIFNEKLFNEYNILTSKGIQTRYFQAIYKRTDVKVIKEYLLIDVSDRNNIRYYSVLDNGNKDASIVSDIESTQSKVKESKENNNKEEIKKEEKKKFSFDFSNFDVRFLDVIKTWLEYKKERKEQYRGQKSLDAFYKNLVKLSENNPETATLIIEQSMGNNWAGIFKPKDSDKPKLQNDTYKRKAIISGNSLQLL